jgi:hypothetical protein
MSTRICAVTTESTFLRRPHKHPDRDHSIPHRAPPAWAYKSYVIMITSSQKYTRQTWVVLRPLIPLIQEILGQWAPGGGLCKSHYVTPFPAFAHINIETDESSGPFVPHLVSSFLDSLMYTGITVTSRYL